MYFIIANKKNGIETRLDADDEWKMANDREKESNQMGKKKHTENEKPAYKVHKKCLLNCFIDIVENVFAWNTTD